MTVVMFVVMLTIPVLMVAKKNVPTVVLVAVWGFCLGMTPAGQPLARLLNQAGQSIAGMVS